MEKLRLVSKACILLILAALLPIGTSAQLTELVDGKVYRFINKSDTNIAMAASGANSVHGVTADSEKTTQLWYVEVVSEGVYTLRNCGTGTYLVGNGQSSFFSLTDDPSATNAQFKLYTVDTYNCIRSVAHDNNGYGYAHYATSQGGGIVGWTTSDATQWTITSVDKTEAEIEQFWNDADDFNITEDEATDIKTALYNIFSDEACTTLNSSYASKTDDQLDADANYTALPGALQDMVKKVRDNAWEEYTADQSKTWNTDYAKKFRVQMYEPYSIRAQITSFLRINAHNNMDNPTGLYANTMQNIYIMVEGKIADGAELWIGHLNGHGQLGYYNSSSYTKLEQGLNIVPYYADNSALWINYVVHTYNSSGTTDAERFPNKVTDYKPLKIHIEGGYINGFYNAIGDYRADATSTEDLWGEVDNDEDWTYYNERATLADFTLLGHYQTLQFDKEAVSTGDNGIAYHLNKIINSSDADYTIPTVPYCYGSSYDSYTDMGLNTTNGRINIMLEAWDRIHASQLATMGVISPEAMQKMNELYPRWTAEGERAEIYDYTGASALDGKTYKEFCGGIDYSEYFNHHGLALGATSGYMSGGWLNCNYHYNTLSSIIGLIASQHGPTWGPAHEIGHQHQGIINLNGQTEVTNNMFANIAVWYMGMGTSRVNGTSGSLESVLAAYNTEDNDFYTNNIWAQTHMYYRLWLYYHLAGKNTQFMPRLMELCRRDPLANGTSIQGKDSFLKFYKHCCDASGDDLTEFFRAHGYLEVMENRHVGDYTSATYNQTQEDIDEAIAYVKAKNYPANLAVLLINDATGETGVSHDGTTARALWDGSATAEYGSYLDIIDGTVPTDYTATANADGTVTMSGGENAMGFLIFDENGELLSFSNKSTFAISDETALALMQGTATVTSVSSESETEAVSIDVQAMYVTLLQALIDEVSPIIDLKDDTYSRVGFYIPSAVEELEVAFNNAQDAMNNGTGYNAAYEVLYNEYKEFLALDKAEITIPFSTTSTYVLKAKGKNAAMTLNDSQKVIVNSSADETAAATRWQFKETATAGTYNIYNTSGYYLPTVTQSGEMTATTTETDFGAYTLEEKSNGIYAIRLSPAAQYTNLHADGSNNVVGWETGNSNSQWYITKVEQDAVELNTIKLEELITKADNFLSSVAEIDTGANLQNSSPTDKYYIYSNATIAEGDLTKLWDNNGETHIHTAWEGNTADGENHYLRIYLGEEPTLKNFQFEYVTRNNVNTEKPKQITLAGCDTENGEYTTIATLTDLPSASAETYTSSEYDATGYKYLRFMVDDTYRELYDGNNHKVYSMAEFRLIHLAAPVAVMNSEYSTVESSLALSVYEKIVAAQAAIAADDKTEATIEAAYDELDEAYGNLETAIKTVDDAALSAEKLNLQALINETSTLITQVGTANIQGAAYIDLHGKIYAHEPYTTGGTGHSDYSSAENDYNLLDGDITTYFHSDYNSTTIAEENYIQVDLGEGNELQNIEFTYSTRSTGTNCPTEIKVYGGSNNKVLGDRTNADVLNNTTTAIRIAIKNVSNNNSHYFAATSNIESYSESVIFIWEPVNEGTAGSYYLCLESQGENGYIQPGSDTGSLTLGTKETAQTFHAIAPTTDGSGINKANTANENYNPSDALDYAVRLAATDNTLWINCNGTSGVPYYTASKTGGFTVHNIYLINDEPSYGSEPVITFTSSDANPLPTVSGTWESGEIDAGAAYRYYKFRVTNVEDGNYYTVDGVKRCFFVMSEFSMNTPAVYEVSVDAGYTDLVSEELLAETQTAVNNANYMLEAATSAEQLQSQYSNLLAAKNALSDAANNMDAIKEGLQDKIDATTELYNKMAVVTDGVTTINSNYTYTAVEVATLEATAAELAEAQNVMNTEGLTANDIATAINELDVYYQKLSGWEDDNIADRTELSTLLSDVATLLGEMTTTDDTETTIALQCENPAEDYYIWSNAPEATGDEGEIKNLIDTDASSYFHTNWSSTTAPEDGLDHHLTIELGDNAISSFKFYYQARDDVYNWYGSYPSTIKVQGSKDGEEYIDLAIIYPKNDEDKVPVDGEEWTSDVIGNGIPYSYLRFMVTATVNYNQTASNGKKDGHVYFHMAEFDLISTGEVSINEEYISPNFDASLITDAIVEKSAKQVMHDSDHLSAEYYTAAVAELKAIKEALTIAKEYSSLPVQLTTDTENPVLYNILINRSDYKKSILEYDASSQKVAVKDFALGNKNQGWYFTPASDGKVNILPWQAEGKMLSTNSYSEGTDKVIATESATDGYGYDWSIDAIDGSEWFNISIDHVTTVDEETTTTKYYFSNYGGVFNTAGANNNIGFYNTNNTTDGGSQFKFELADYSKSEAYCTLYNYHAPLETVKVGNYISAYSNGDAYNTAYNTATELLEGNNSDDDTYTTAYNTLKSTYEALEKNEIVDGDYYVIRSANPANNLAIIYGATDNMLYWNGSKTTTDASCIWKITKVDGGYNFTNLNTGTSMINLNAFEYYITISLSNIHNDSQNDDAPSTVELVELGKGQLRIGGTWWLHSQSNGHIVKWNTGDLDSNSAWYIEPADETAVTRDLAVSKYEWTSLHLGYAVTIPDEVTAYYSTGVDGSDVELVEIADGVIPANTGVLINAPEGTYTLEYTTTDVTYADNALIGCNHDIYVEAANSYTYYVLAIGAADKAALCYIYKEVSFDENGNMTFTEGDDNGTHFKLPAHKVYLPVENASNIKMFSFRVIDGTTDIDGVCSENNAIENIYDLSGRKLEEITAPGVYIINGKKVLVNKVKRLVD